VAITDGKAADVTLLDALVYESGAFYILDRGDPDFGRLYRITEALAFFVIRGKRGLDYVRRVSQPIDKTLGLRSDQTIMLCGPKTATLYPVPLRRITYLDGETGQRFVFLTNNFTLPPLQIAQLYKCRWQVELFFKWIKQHLRITAFYGTSVNAVKTQVGTAISVYVLVAILKKELGLPQSLYTILQVLSVALFEKTPIHQALAQLPDPTVEGEACNQLSLFDR
jgi:IS4 transposase